MHMRKLMFLVVKLLVILTLLLLSACSSTGEKKSSKELFTMLDKANNAYSEGNWLEAEMYYQQLIEKVPEDSYAWMRMGNARLQTGQINAAIAAYQESIKHSPNQSKPYYNLSTAYMIQAQRALETAKRNMQKHDAGNTLVDERIKGLKALTTGGISGHEQSSENTSQNENVIRYYMSAH